MLEDDRESIIMDVGSGTIKAGFSSEDTPKCVIPMIVGEKKEKYQNNINNFSFGQQALDDFENFNLFEPV
jgi:actin-related protein